MASTVTIDLRHVVRGLNLPLPQVQAVVELLDDGNTVPFIARFRKDQTGGLDEEHIRQIKARLTKSRLLAERKQTILRAIDSQGKLTEKLAKQIQVAGTTKRLEDLYLAYKPKKQTLATTARSRGLEELAQEILEANPAALDLDRRAADFANPDKQVPTAADALLGAGHILAEQFSERPELRLRLREILQRSGTLISNRIGGEAKAGPVGQAASPAAVNSDADTPQTANADTATVSSDGQASIIAVPADEVVPTVEPVAADAASDSAAEQAESAETNSHSTSEPSPPRQTTFFCMGPDSETPDDSPETAEPVPTEVLAAEVAPPEAVAEAAVEVAAEALPAVAPAATVAAEPAPAARPPRKRDKGQRKLSKAELKKKKKEEQKQKAFADYYDYSEEIKRIPPHRTLAINRGERAKVLRVRMECDLEAMHKALDELLVPPEHPHADFLRGCARDALTRLILPSLEREVRRELTDRAELHAVEVFARNLRNLLLQPPVGDRRVLAIDPGFKSGCKLAALDELGNVLDQGLIFLIGKEDRRQEAAAKVVELIDRLQIQAIVIGNGTACRETEDFVGGLIGNQLAGRGISYVIVNEAGASVYANSPEGREEFPNYDASLRGAISIGRRLQDPLSELVKIDPANIGVGLYQHDVKAKHLRSSLDEVVESCVNYVGVNVNTASPALLRYVSGLNQLTARRLYEHRRQNGPFRNRQQLKDVAGFGEATFVQAAGFLKIGGGDNPLDATWIHPESYDIAARVLAKLGFAPADLLDKEKAASLAESARKVDVEALAKEIEVGAFTLKDILSQLARPGRDPREDLPAPVFKQGVLKLEDLTAGLELSGTILNVVDFGAFVDIGVHHSGLIHVSQMADRFIRDPHEVVAVGDVVKVWVMEVDKERRRVSLTMIPPGTPRMHGRRPTKPEETPAEPPPPKEPPRKILPDRTPRPVRGHRPQQQRGGRPSADGQPSGGRGRADRGRGGYGGRGGRGGHGERADESRPPVHRPAPKKPIVPISEEMKSGKAPLRSFSDLAQFFTLQHSEPADDAQPAAPAETPATAAEPTNGPSDDAVAPATDSQATPPPADPSAS